MEEKLWFACEDGKVEEVIKLLQNPQLNVNWQDSELNTPLYIACFKGHIEIVALFLVNFFLNEQDEREEFVKLLVTLIF